MGIYKKFEALDVDGSGYLDQEDLEKISTIELMAEMQKKVEQESLRLMAKGVSTFDEWEEEVSQLLGEKLEIDGEVPPISYIKNWSLKAAEVLVLKKGATYWLELSEFNKRTKV